MYVMCITGERSSPLQVRIRSLDLLHNALKFTIQTITYNYINCYFNIARAKKFIAYDYLLDVTVNFKPNACITLAMVS